MRRRFMIGRRNFEGIKKCSTNIQVNFQIRIEILIPLNLLMKLCRRIILTNIEIQKEVSSKFILSLYFLQLQSIIIF